MHRFRRKNWASLQTILTFLSIKPLSLMEVEMLLSNRAKQTQLKLCQILVNKSNKTVSRIDSYLKLRRNSAFSSLCSLLLREKVPPC